MPASSIYRVVLTPLLLAANAFAADKPKAFPNPRILKVHSGDSVDMKLWGRTRRVRLFGIDAPEKSQALAREARDYLDKLLRDSNLRLDAPGGADPGDLDAVPKIVKKLDTIVIPKIELKEMSLKKVIEAVDLLSEKLDPDKDGVRILLAAPPVNKLDPPLFKVTDRPADKKGEATADDEMWGSMEADPKQISISLKFEKITLGALLRHIALGAGLWMRVEQYAVVLYNHKPPYPRVPAVFTLSAYSPARGYSISYLMVRNGYARIIPQGVYGTVGDELKHAEALAKKEKLGIWALKHDHPPPWKYRLYKTKAEAADVLKPEALWP